MIILWQPSRKGTRSPLAPHERQFTPLHAGTQVPRTLAYALPMNAQQCSSVSLGRVEET